jgi:glycosyltransferase involved in cell wall biosynthesis
MDEPKISVIVPVYNSEKYVERCINSICAQTFKEFELLLIDDCSRDNSLEICREFEIKDSRIKVYHKTSNEGTAQARKTGVFYAKGEYTLFCDNDDWIEPAMLEELYTKIKSENFDMVCCDFYYNKDCGYKYLKQDTGNKTNIELIGDIISWGDFLPITWNKLVITEIYRKIDFPKTTYSEDRAIMTQVLYYCDKIGYVNKELYHWEYIPTSASRTNERMSSIKNTIDDYISYTVILLFVIDNKINMEKFIKDIINHAGSLSLLLKMRGGDGK